jgi:AcrR family transcriptional regulator
MQLARRGGVNALGLRELTRAVGVTANAAYRHFADHQALVLAVADEAQDRLAHAMLDKIATIPRDLGPGEYALAELRAVGLGYVQFALSEPGWFELAILTQNGRPENSSVEERAPLPYQLLLDALEHMVEAGVLAPERRRNAEWACWCTVHGIADLATRGPLHEKDRAAVDEIAEYAVESIISGVRGEPAPVRAAPGRPPRGA